MAPVSLDQARSILSRVFTAAGQSESATGAAARAAQQTAYTGEGLRAVRARVRLARTRTTSEPSPLLAQQQPTVLALSRGLGFPRFILAQSVRTKGGLPVLHLLTSPDAATPYRISESAEMMPLAVVKPFGSLSDGSPLAGAGTGLAVSPATLLDLYARQMDFPRKAAANLPWAEDSFSNQVRARAAAVAHDVATQARFAQAHRVVKGSVYAVRQPGGSALVFGPQEGGSQPCLHHHPGDAGLHGARVQRAGHPGRGPRAGRSSLGLLRLRLLQIRCGFHREWAHDFEPHQRGCPPWRR